MNKKKYTKWGLIPAKEPEVIPWHTVCIDLIGPYPVGYDKKDKNNKIIDANQIILHCLTMIDPATGWFEIVEIANKTAIEVANQFEKTWLNRYPWPKQVVMDRGTEFCAEVIELLKDHGITRKLITTRNPQANAMVERAHQTIHTLIQSQGIKGKRDLPDGWSGILGAVALGMRATVHTTNRATPSQLVFGRDHFLSVNFEADWQYIKERKQAMIRQNNQRENSKRKPHTYQVNDQVLVKLNPSRKHGEARYKGPYRVTRVNDNGTLELEQGTPNGGAVLQTWNIRNVFPYEA